MTLLLVVLLASLAGGAPAGFVAAVLATVGMEWAFIPEVESFEPDTSVDVLAAALFAVRVVRGRRRGTSPRSRQP